MEKITYEGQTVTIDHSVEPNDPEYMRGKNRVVITLSDGTKKTIERSELQFGEAGEGE